MCARASVSTTSYYSFYSDLTLGRSHHALTRSKADHGVRHNESVRYCLHHAAGGLRALAPHILGLSGLYRRFIAGGEQSVGASSMSKLSDRSWQ